MNRGPGTNAGNGQFQDRALPNDEPEEIDVIIKAQAVPERMRRAHRR
jgi:hypothetical protein